MFYIIPVPKKQGPEASLKNCADILSWMLKTVWIFMVPTCLANLEVHFPFLQQGPFRQLDCVHFCRVRQIHEDFMVQIIAFISEILAMQRRTRTKKVRRLAVVILSPWGEMDFTGSFYCKYKHYQFNWGKAVQF